MEHNNCCIVWAAFTSEKEPKSKILSNSSPPVQSSVTM